jgi:hypothetical protein
MRRILTLCAVLLAAGCAVQPHREPVADLAGFETLAEDARVRYEPGTQDAAAHVAALLPAAIAQVEAGHYLPFAAPVTVYVCGTTACFEQRVPGASRFTAAVAYDNRLLLAPRLFEREPQRLYPVLVHELSHLHLGQRLGHYTMRIPVWFHEGLASLVAAGGGADLVSEEEARRAIAAGDYFLPDAAHDPTRRKYADHWQLRIAMFYRQSMMLLASLKSASEERFRALIESLQRRVPFDDAFTSAYGSNARDLAQQYFEGIHCDHQECGAPAAAP